MLLLISIKVVQAGGECAAVWYPASRGISSQINILEWWWWCNKNFIFITEFLLFLMGISLPIGQKWRSKKSKINLFKEKKWRQRGRFCVVAFWSRCTNNVGRRRRGKNSHTILNSRAKNFDGQFTRKRNKKCTLISCNKKTSPY